MSEMQVALSQDFFSAFARIPRAQQNKVNKFVSKFRTDPRSSGINYEKLNDAANADFRSVRIDQDYRAIVLKPSRGNVYLLLWVDKHDDAYDWARRHKCAVNPETGSLQLYEVVQGGTSEPPAEAAAPAAAPKETAPSPGPLLPFRDRELLRMGVPQERLEAVKSLTTLAQLDALGPNLPVEAFEALSFLADGIPLEEVMGEYALPQGAKVDAADVSAALQRPHSQRRFHVVDDEATLQQMLDAPLEQWRVFLHPSQRKLVERDWNGPIRVLGGAGTGKTVVAMHRARWLVRHRLQPDERLLLTTYTHNLAMDIEANLRKICTSEEMRQIEVLNIDAWVRRFLKNENHPADIQYAGQSGFERCWSKAIQFAPGELDLPDSFYEEEWDRVILPQRVLSQQDYFRASRIGRGVPLSRKQRAQIWKVFEEMRFQLHQAGITTSADAVFQVLDMLEGGAVVRPYRAAVVDEAQDFGLEALRLVRALVPDEKNDLMIVGDGHQRIYGRKAPLSKAGINIRGRGRKLRVNYRTTEEIRRFAVAVLEGIKVDDLDDGMDGANGYRSLLLGQAPVLKGFDSADAEADWVLSEIHQLIEDGIRSQDICVVGRTRKQLQAVGTKLQGSPHGRCELTRASADNSDVPGVRMANMHRVKGLEFKVVFLVGISEGIVPFEYGLGKTQDPTEKQIKESNDRALLHVAGTRAIQALYVSWVSRASPFIIGY